MQLIALSTVNFRNLAAGPIRWRAGVNLIVGDNGQGKSNLLEALTVLGNLRSFRGAGWGAMVRHGSAGCDLAGEVRGAVGPLTRIEQTVLLTRPLERRFRMDGQPVGAADYLWVCPVFAVSSSDADLVTGPPRVRRSFLDRFAFLLDAHTLAEARRYRRALAQRNAALRAGTRDQPLAAWEEALAGAAARLVERRRATAERLRDAFAPVYDTCRGVRFPDVELGYQTEGWLDADASPQTLEESYRKRYNATRARDRRAGYTTEGPHRHDLLLRTDGRPAREVLSSGQTKIVATALRLATVTAVEEERGEQFPVVIDDVDAELDSTILARLSVWLRSGRQVFLSTARPEAVTPLLPDCQLMTIHHGLVTAE